MLNCLAIDDEPLALSLISRYIGNVSFLNLVQACTSAFEAQKWLKKKQIDLIFVDIDMPDFSGIEFAKWLPAENKPQIIFTTAYAQYAVEGFKLNATDYLLKPFSYDEFFTAAQKALRVSAMLNREANASPRTSASHLFVKADHRVIQLDLDQIQYIESQGEYIRIFRQGHKPVMTVGSLKALEDRLPAHQFMRVHRSYIIHLKHISEVTKNRIVIDKVYIPIGAQYREPFIRFMSDHAIWL